MLLAIDIGNSNIVFGLWNEHKWVRIWRIETDVHKTPDEYEVIFRGLIESSKTDKPMIGQVVLSCVVPSLIREFEQMLAHYIGRPPLVLSPSVFERLPLKVMNPYEIGSDLVANAMAAYSQYPGPCMVIDFGTALTFTTISGEGAILGVAIAPGLRTAINALSGSTAQLPDVQPQLPPSVLGTNTVHAIQSGIVIGYTGLVDRIIEETEKAIGAKLTVIATGGLATAFEHRLTKITYLSPDLTLDGLRLIGEIAC